MCHFFTSTSLALKEGSAYAEVTFHVQTFGCKPPNIYQKTQHVILTALRLKPV